MNETDLGELIVADKKNLLKSISFYNYRAPKLPLENAFCFLVNV